MGTLHVGTLSVPRWSRVLIPIALLGILQPTKAANLSTLSETAKHAVVVVRCQQPDGSMTQGSGFMIAPTGTVVTAYHLVSTSRVISIKTSKGDVFDITDVVGLDKQRDLVLLRFSASAVPSLPLAPPGNLVPGALILLPSDPLRLDGSLAQGVVSAIRDSGQPGEALEFTAPAAKSGSGTPLLNEMGQVVGLVTNESVGKEGLRVALPVQHVQRLLDTPKVLPLGVLANSNEVGKAPLGVNMVNRVVLRSQSTPEQPDPRNVGAILMMSMESHLNQAGFAVVPSAETADAELTFTWSYESLNNKYPPLRGHINLTLAAVVKSIADGRVLWGGSTEAQDSPRMACDRSARTLAAELATARTAAP